MNSPQVYLIKPEQLGQEDLHQFLYTAIAREFSGKEYTIVGEVPLDRIIPGRPGIRRIVGLNVESGGTTHAIYFDVTEVQTARSSSWFGS
jgi:hypothetical protein